MEVIFTNRFRRAYIKTIMALLATPLQDVAEVQKLMHRSVRPSITCLLQYNLAKCSDSSVTCLV